MGPAQEGQIIWVFKGFLRQAASAAAEQTSSLVSTGYILVVHQQEIRGRRLFKGRPEFQGFRLIVR